MKKLKISEVKFHPKYNGLPDCGYDIAICKVAEELPGKNATNATYSNAKELADHFSGPIEPEDL